MGTSHHPYLTPLTPSMPLCDSLGHEDINSLPVTPPEPATELDITTRPDSKAIAVALHVISTERAALAHLKRVYETSDFARQSLAQAIDVISHTCQNHGKVVVTGVGKSGKIGQKLVATFNSLGVQSCFLHPTEALHGDLGVIKPVDAVLMLTFSGSTPELLLLLRHIDAAIPLIALTSHTVPSTCRILHNRPNSILLPAPVHEPEKVSFGISAPTTSTTVALAIGDGLALAIADRLHTAPGRSPADVFQSYHPGGAIGAAAAADSAKGSVTITPLATIPLMSSLAISVASVPVAQASRPDHILRCIDILLNAVQSPSGWVRPSPMHMIAPRRTAKLLDPDLPIADAAALAHSSHPDHAPLVIEKSDWISVLGSCTVDECRSWILRMRREGRGRDFLKKGTILGIVDDMNEVSGVVEIENVVGEELSD